MILCPTANTHTDGIVVAAGGDVLPPEVYFTYLKHSAGSAVPVFFLSMLNTHTHTHGDDSDDDNSSDTTHM